MTLLSVAIIVLGALLLAAGVWWLGASRWFPESRLQRGVSEPTRLVVSLVHLILGYHAIVWAGPPAGRERAIHIPRPHWPWVAAGCAGLIGLSFALDRIEARAGGREGEGAGGDEG